MFSQLISQFAVGCASSGFFLIPHWYEYFQKAGSYLKPDGAGGCTIDPQLLKNGALNLDAIGLLGLGIIDILLRVAALVAVGFIVYAGFEYLTAQGEPDKAKKALGTIISALIGLGITIVSSAAVAFVGTRIG